MAKNKVALFSGHGVLYILYDVCCFWQMTEYEKGGRVPLLKARLLNFDYVNVVLSVGFRHSLLFLTTRGTVV